MQTHKNYNPWRVYGGLMLAMLFWGISYIWTKQVLVHLQPISIIFLRLIISTSFLLCLGLVTRKLQKPRRADTGWWLLMAFIEPFLYFTGENIGMKYVSTTVASVLIATIPVFSAIAGFLFYKQKLSTINIVGMFISLVGVVMVLVKGDFSLNVPVTGILLISLAVFAATGYSVMVVKLSEHYNVVTMLTYQSIIGLVYFLPVFLIFEWDTFNISAIPTTVLPPLFSLAVLASSLAFLFFSYGIQKLGIARASMFSNIIPVITAIVAYFLLGETLTLLNIAGIGMVVGGVLLSEIK